MSEWAWTNKHQWDWTPEVFTSNPPQFKATCKRCGVQKMGTMKAFEVNDCPGLVSGKS